MLKRVEEFLGVEHGSDEVQAGDDLTDREPSLLGAINDSRMRLSDPSVVERDKIAISCEEDAASSSSKVQMFGVGGVGESGAVGGRHVEASGAQPLGDRMGAVGIEMIADQRHFRRTHFSGGPASLQEFKRVRLRAFVQKCVANQSTGETFLSRIRSKACSTSEGWLASSWAANFRSRSIPSSISGRWSR